MSVLRRIAAVLFGVLLLPGLAPGGGGWCLSPGDGVASAAIAEAGIVSTAHEGHGEHLAERHASRPESRDGVPANAPAQSQHHAQQADQSSDDAPTHSHCLIATTCSPAGLAAATAHVIESAQIATGMVAARDENAPRSPRGAPEPPPPRR